MDGNELVDRSRLLYASQEHGNNHTKEIILVIEECPEKKIVF